MGNDFAIFILSHNRADKIDTLSMLEKYKYSGKLYVVISEDNNQIGEYIKVVKGRATLLIFDKQDYLDIDTHMGSDNPMLGVALYARNFVVQKAKQMRLKHYLMIDDDVTKLFFRYEDNGHLKQKEIKSINPILSSMIDFLDCSTHIGGLSSARDGGYFGGLKGNFAKGLTRKLNSFALLKTTEDWNFCSALLDDEATYIKNYNRLFFTIWGVSHDTPPISSNGGGITYDKSPYYLYSFTYILRPSAIVMRPWGKDMVSYTKLLPKIISDRWKKR